MLPYVFTFSATAFFAYLLQRSDRFKQKAQFYLFGFLTIIIPCILGGMRALSVGTDNAEYYNSFLTFSHTSSPFQAISTSRLEFGYGLLNYLISRFTTDYHWLCFFTELITVSFIVLGLYYFRDKISLPLGILAYLLLQYCNCINIVRQGIALAIVFFAMRYALEQKPVKFFIFIAIAVTFHTTALIGIAIYFIFMIMRGKHEIRNLVLICICAFIGVYLAYYISSFLINLNILSESYSRYFSPGLHFSLIRTLFCIPVLLVSTLLYRVLSNKFEIYKCLYALLWVEIIVVQLAETFDPAYRFALYFGYVSIVVLPMFPKAFTQRSRPWAVGLVLLYLAIYWGYFTVANGYGFHSPVYPYITDLF